MDISWNCSKSVQEEAKRILIEHSDYDIKILLEIDDKSCWENAAQILKSKGCEKTKEIIDLLFLQIRDLNWPGSKQILDLLRTFPQKLFQPAYERAICSAIRAKDDEWLDYLAIFIYEKKVEKKIFVNKFLYDILKDHLPFWL